MRKMSLLYRDRGGPGAQPGWVNGFQQLYVFAHDPHGERYGRGGNQFPLTLYRLHGDSVAMAKVADDF